MKDNNQNKYHGLEIAVIGMAGKFPKSNNLQEFWSNIEQGKDCVSFFTEDELIEAGVDEELVKNELYVKASSYLEEKDKFDFSFFQYTPAEAKAMDPQMRLLHQCIWEALEDSGYNSLDFKGQIGLYTSASSNFKWEIFSNINAEESGIDDYSLKLLNDKDYIASRIAYKLNLKGPVVNLNTACSSSLVSIHEACKSILLGECDIALAGGVTITNTSKIGYMYQEGMILSPDGHCRAFDQKAAGTVSGEGVGMVVLKRLKNAIADGDNIQAIIKGSAINNDGNRKVGYVTPSVAGQVQVIKRALKMSRIESNTIEYIEAHGTATPVGDSMELDALHQVFGDLPRQKCGLGSVKTNMGHCNSAAGVAGFIKTVLALKNKTIPPSLYCDNANAAISESSPFYINTKLKAWESQGIRRAGVSSFGIGGTNAHVILEEAPDQAYTIEQQEVPNVLVFSGKTEKALSKNIENFKHHVQNNPKINLSHAAFTLACGRNHHDFREAVVVNNFKEVASKLSFKGHAGLIKKQNEVAFLFSGQGAQYIKMGYDLYAANASFRNTIDACFEIANEYVDYDLRDCLIKENDAAHIHNTQYAQPLLFIIEYSLAKLLIEANIVPQVMIGHSLGEYVAACIGGVIELKDAIKLVIKRGEFMQQMKSGSMLSVMISMSEFSTYIDDTIAIDVAAINSHNNIILSGEEDELKKIEIKLKADNHYYRYLQTSHAFHSSMMDPMLEKFRLEFNGIILNEPSIPIVSNLTGKLVSADDITTPDYWVNHLRNRVNFYDGVKEIITTGAHTFIEIGPGNSLTQLVNNILDNDESDKDSRAFNLLKTAGDSGAGNQYFLNQLGSLWAYGVNFDWSVFYTEEERRRISIPTYAFDEYSFPVEFDLTRTIEQQISGTIDFNKKNESDWYYIPQWQNEILTPYSVDGALQGERILVFCNENDFDTALIAQLNNQNADIITVRVGDHYSKHDENKYVVNPELREDYDKLFQDIKGRGYNPRNIIHLWSLQKAGVNDIKAFQNIGLYSLLNIALSLTNNHFDEHIRINVISSGMHKVFDSDILHLPSSTLLGAIKVIPLEFINLGVQNIDISASAGQQVSTLVDQVCKEISIDSDSHFVAYRGGSRWVPSYSSIKLDDDKAALTSRLKENGAYLITGGFGGMGLSIAKYLTKSVKANVILVGRSLFPERQEWTKHVENNSAYAEKIKVVQEMEASGGAVLICRGDVSIKEQMVQIIEEAKSAFGQINGVIHSAGVIDYGGVILNRTNEVTEKYMAPKVEGTLIIDELLKDEPLDFFALFSSIGNVLYSNKFGQLSYNASNEFLEAFAHYKNQMSTTHAVTINWCDWKEVGMTVNANSSPQEDDNRNQKNEESFDDALSPDEGVKAFIRVLGSNLTHVTITKTDLNSRLVRMKELLKDKEQKLYSGFKKIEDEYLIQRPDLSSEYQKAETEIEEKVVELWEEMLGISQIGINDNFYELGGDSLKAMIMLSRLQKLLQLTVPLKDFMEEPTISTISNYLSLFLPEDSTDSSTLEKDEFVF